MHYAMTDLDVFALNVAQAKASARYQLRSPTEREMNEIFLRFYNLARGGGAHDQCVLRDRGRRALCEHDS